MKNIKLYILFLFIWSVVIAGISYANGPGHEHQGHDHFSLSSLIVPLGITTLVCLISTFVLGLMMPKNRKALFPWHKRMAIITLISAITHGTMVLFFH